MASSVVGRLSRVIERRVEVYGVLDPDDVIIHLERYYAASEQTSREAIELGRVRGMFLVRTVEGGRTEIRRQVVLQEAL